MTTPATRARMTPTRKAALIAGIAYIATFVFSIPVKFGLWEDVLNNTDWIFGSGDRPGVALGAVFEMLTALGGVVSAVAVYAVAKRYNQRNALGFVTTRVMEAGLIFVGVLAIMSLDTLRLDAGATAAAADTGALLTIRHALVAVHDWAFLFGPGIMATLNALCIAWVMYQARLLPRWIPTLGLIGAPILFASSMATVFGVWDQISGPAIILTLPIAVWELSFGVHMAVKGFRTPPPSVEAAAIAAAVEPVATSAPQPARPVAVDVAG